ncbi:hypothetical protein [Bathymodiolus thermophilus thioautotrophic gill symbiont]|uniref:hypothetical protein n=1 Tax=Bathymodiolus thermophilus thioautotrophic gill symbiont TaxID=2360 RepID=UPI00192CA322|nr:hypothetical protein [Bathymodiolus thermophilus thioautotrophic gill symbiont]
MALFQGLSCYCYKNIHSIGGLCININNHQESTFHPLGNFLNPALALQRTRFKKITKWAKIEYHPYLCKGLH